MPPPPLMRPPPGSGIDPETGDWQFDPWVPPEIQAQTIAWAQAERPVTPAEAGPYHEAGTWPPWGVRPEIGSCTSRGGTWSPDASFETMRGSGGRCDFPNGKICGALDHMRGHCSPDLPDPVDPVDPDPDPIDPWPVDPIPPNGKPDAWLWIIAAALLLG